MYDIVTGDLSPALDHLNKLIAFSTKSLEISFKRASISTKIIISLFMEPYLNVIKISVCNLDNLEVNFYNSVPTRQNNLFQTAKKECWIHNPQICKVLTCKYFYHLRKICLYYKIFYFTGTSGCVCFKKWNTYWCNIAGH